MKKKLLFFIFILIVSFSLWSCGDKSTDPETHQEKEESEDMTSRSFTFYGSVKDTNNIPLEDASINLIYFPEKMYLGYPMMFSIGADEYGAVRTFGTTSIYRDSVYAYASSSPLDSIRLYSGVAMFRVIKDDFKIYMSFVVNSRERPNIWPYNWPSED